MQAINHDKFKGEMTNGETASERLAEIAAISTIENGVTRRPWTLEHRGALDIITTWMEDAGLSVEMDAAGTLCGKSDNPDGKPVLLVGSHQDSVPSGGAYDGIMGVALGCLAARDLRDRIAEYPFALEVLAFADEEGVRFPTALTRARGLTRECLDEYGGRGHPILESAPAIAFHVGVGNAQGQEEVTTRKFFGGIMCALDGVGDWPIRCENQRGGTDVVPEPPRDFGKDR